jgi:hypothetical protein
LNIDDNVNKSHTKTSNGTPTRDRKDEKSVMKADKKNVGINGSATKEAKIELAASPKIDFAVQSISPPSEKNSPQPAWGKKLSFIDVVRKQV